MPHRSSRDRLQRKAERGFQGYPVGTIAFYGPDDRRATKVAVGIVRRDGGEAEEMEKWFSEAGDVQDDPVIGAQILAFLQRHAAKTVAIGSGILGCPHEEGVDYAVGGTCPRCPFWAGRARPI